MLILIDENDLPIGQMAKMEAHEKGLLHRAFSVFIFNTQGMLLMQQRALGKYHSPRLWTNTCCSHPFPGEDVKAAAIRRLNQEMGITTELTFLFKMTYKHEFDNGLTEHEVDNVFVGYTNSLPIINKDEVNDYKYISPDELKSDMELNPEQYTPWFRIIMDDYYIIINECAKKAIKL